MKRNWTAALENADCTEIKLGGNIETTWELDVERTVTLDLNGYTLSCSSTDEDIIRVRSSGNLTVKDSGNRRQDRRAEQELRN